MASPAQPLLSQADISSLVEMAWQDRTPFEAIALQYGLNEPDVVQLMRQQLKKSSFHLWRKRMAGRQTKHGALRAVATRANKLQALPDL